MYGAILGDIIGSAFEFDRGGKTKEFPLFSEESTWTDDTVMTVAVAEALLEAERDATVEESEAACVKSMQKWGKESIPMPDMAQGSFTGYTANTRSRIRAMVTARP